MNQINFLEKLNTTPKPFTAEEWIRELKLDSVQEMEDFFALVRKMEDEGLIVITKKQKIQLLDDSDFFRGKLSIHPKGYGFVDHDKGSLYIPSYQFKGAMHEDEVLVKPKVYADLSSEGEIIRVLKRNTTQLVGTWKRVKDEYQVVVQDPRLFSEVKCIDADTSHLVEGNQLLVDIVNYGNPIEVTVKKVLGHITDPGMDILTILLNHQVPMEFNEATMEEVNRIPMTVPETDRVGRVDYRDRIVVTIDGEDAKDFDDAISIRETDNGFKLDVHIADVSAYVTERSALDEEARKRGTSVYVVDRVVPMLPHALSNGICSLMEGVDRLTLTCTMSVTMNGEVSDYEIHPSIIRSTRRMTYTEVNQILKRKPETMKKHEDILEQFFIMQRCAKIIRKNRDNAGSINFSTVESKFNLDEKGKILSIEARVQAEAESLIEDFMILANETVASHLKWLEVPALYRVHEAPDKKRFGEFNRMAQFWGIKLRYEHLTPKAVQNILSKFEGKQEFPLVNDLLLRSMSKAKYDPKCIGHFGLALKEYCHFTSPIRRYPDLIVHRMLRKHVFMHHPKQIGDDIALMEQLGFETSWSEQRAVDSERDVEAMKKSEYMESHIGEEFNGLISSVAKFGFFVRLSNTVEGLVHVSNLDGYFEFDADRFALVKRGSRISYRLGQSVRVKVLNADKIKQTIDFLVV